MFILHTVTSCIRTFPPKLCYDPFRLPLNVPLLLAVWSTVVRTIREHVCLIVSTAVHPQLCTCLLYQTTLQWPHNRTISHLIIPCFSAIARTTAGGVSTRNILFVYIRTLAFITTIVEQGYGTQKLVWQHA